MGLSPGFRGSPDVTLAWKAMHDVGQGFALGVEYYNDIGTPANRLPRDQQGRTLYAVMEIERKTWSLNFGVGHGVTLHGQLDRQGHRRIPSIETPVILSDRMDSALERLSETIRAAAAPGARCASAAAAPRIFTARRSRARC